MFRFIDVEEALEEQGSFTALDQLWSTTASSNWPDGWDLILAHLGLDRLPSITETSALSQSHDTRDRCVSKIASTVRRSRLSTLRPCRIALALTHVPLQLDAVLVYFAVESSIATVLAKSNNLHFMAKGAAWA